MKPRTLILVNSDNFENQLMTFEAYAELRLQMSTGDFHTHTHEVVESLSEDVLELADLIDA